MPTTGDGRPNQYAPAHASDEIARLVDQAGWLADLTEQLFRDADMQPGMRGCSSPAPRRLSQLDADVKRRIDTVFEKGFTIQLDDAKARPRPSSSISPSWR